MVWPPAVVLAVQLLLQVAQEGLVGRVLHALLLHLNDAVVDDEDGISMLFLLLHKNFLDSIKYEENGPSLSNLPGSRYRPSYSRSPPPPS